MNYIQMGTVGKFPNSKYWLKMFVYRFTIRHLSTSPNDSGRMFSDAKYRTEEPPIIPPKPPENFSKTYPRKPLYWVATGTDLFKESNKFILKLVLFNFITTLAVIVYLIHKHETKPNWKSFFQRLPNYSMLNKDNLEIAAFREQLEQLSLLSKFKRINVENPGEITMNPSKKQMTDIRRSNQVIRREDTGRDMRKLTMKEVDELLRSDSNLATEKK